MPQSPYSAYTPSFYQFQVDQKKKKNLIPSPQPDFFRVYQRSDPIPSAPPLDFEPQRGHFQLFNYATIAFHLIPQPDGKTGIALISPELEWARKQPQDAFFVGAPPQIETLQRQFLSLSLYYLHTLFEAQLTENEYKAQSSFPQTITIQVCQKEFESDFLFHLKQEAMQHAMTLYSTAFPGSTFKLYNPPTSSYVPLDHATTAAWVPVLQETFAPDLARFKPKIHPEQAAPYALPLMRP